MGICVVRDGLGNLARKTGMNVTRANVSLANTTRASVTHGRKNFVATSDPQNTMCHCNSLGQHSPNNDYSCDNGEHSYCSTSQVCVSSSFPYPSSGDWTSICVVRDGLGNRTGVQTAIH